MPRNTLYTLLGLVMLLTAGCINDSFTTSPADQPLFSTDTLKMGTVYTDEQTATHRLTVYNRHDRSLNIADISLSGDNASLFRLNVDGMSGKTFNNIEIRANDSIFVFVCADIPDVDADAPRTIEGHLDFRVNGVVNTVVISLDGQDIHRLPAVTVTEDTVLEPGRPYRVTDSLVVAEGATLRLQPGVSMLFHDNARLIVRGTLIAEGTPEQPIRLTGDRTGNVITDVSFDLMSRQWIGVEIMPESTGNSLAYTEVSNTWSGVTVLGDGQDTGTRHLRMVNCRLRNSGDCVLTAIGASVEAYGCEFAEAANSLVYLLGGDHRFDQCTASNHYLFAAVSGAAWMLPGIPTEGEGSTLAPTRALVTNTIIYGLGADVMPGDLTGRDVYFRRCLFKSKGEDDDNFTDSLWDQDPLFYTVRNDYIFDYRLKPESPAIEAAYPYLSEYQLETDYYGQERRRDLGAYVYCSPE